MAGGARRRLFIGDVQGCREEFERLLEKLRFDPVADELHVVGDFVNRGPDSLGVLKLARELEVGGVLGNHDLHCLRLAAGREPAKPRDTLDALLRSDERDALLDWLSARPFVREWEDLVCVHAGLHPAWRDFARELAGLDPLERDPASSFAVRVRYCTSAGELPESDDPPPPPPFRPWFDFWPGDRDDARTVVFGHWSRLGLVVREQLRGLDTGCVWGGRLTAWSPDEERFEQVEAARAYSPVSD